MIAPEDQIGVIARFREGPALLEDAVLGLTDADLDAAPSGGGWTIRQIVHHVVDGDDIWKLCIKMAVGIERVEFTLGWYSGVPQQTWADRWAYRQRSVGASLSLLKASRLHVLQLLENVPDAWSRVAMVRKRDGEMEQVPVGFVVQMQADHLLHHIKRIRGILQERGGAWQAVVPDATPGLGN
jgi:uncharacterized damage-inducible protein DinB